MGQGLAAHTVPALGGGGRWHWAQGEGEAELAKNPCPRLMLLVPVPSTLIASDDGQGLVGKTDGCCARAKHVLLTR